MGYANPSGNITDLGDFFSWANGTVDNWFFSGIMVAIFFIIWIKLITSEQGAGKAFVAASFICMILTILLRVANLVSTSFMIIFIICTGIGIVWTHYENSTA